MSESCNKNQKCPNTSLINVSTLITNDSLLHIQAIGQQAPPLRTSAHMGIYPAGLYNADFAVPSHKWMKVIPHPVAGKNP